MTTEQFESLKLGLSSGLIDPKTAEQIISKHEDEDIRKAVASAKGHARTIRNDLGLSQPVTNGLGAIGQGMTRAIEQQRQQPLQKRWVLQYGRTGQVTLANLQADDCANGRVCRSSVCFGNTLAGTGAHNAALAETDNERIG